jgi:hypothetical protein
MVARDVIVSDPEQRIGPPLERGWSLHGSEGSSPDDVTTGPQRLDSPDSFPRQSCRPRRQ